MSIISDFLLSSTQKTVTFRRGEGVCPKRDVKVETGRLCPEEFCWGKFFPVVIMSGGEKLLRFPSDWMIDKQPVD